MSEDKKTSNDKVVEDKNKNNKDNKDKKNSFFNKKDKKDELVEMEGRYKRALADYQNLLKRTAVEKQEFIKFANERLLTEILPVYDNLKMSFKHIGDDAKGNGWLEGIKYVIKQFEDVLKNLGVEEIKTVGEAFDHHAMEAVEKKETDDEDKDGIVESEVMAGYILSDKVIRAARVVVLEYGTNNNKKETESEDFK